MDLGHHRDGRDIPRRCSLFFPGDVFLCMTALAYGFINLHSGVVWRQVGDIHRPATAWLGTGEMLMLQRLQKSLVSLTFLLRFHALYSLFHKSIESFFNTHLRRDGVADLDCAHAPRTSVSLRERQPCLGPLRTSSEHSP